MCCPVALLRYRAYNGANAGRVRRSRHPATRYFILAI